MKTHQLIVPVLLAIVLSGCQAWQIEDIEGLDATAATPAQSEPGKVQILYWDGIEGTLVSDLTASSTYPDTPSEIAELTTLQSLVNRAESYGAMVQGFIAPPTTGEYRFFLSADDGAEFWLSSDQSPDNASAIASVPNWTYTESYNQYSSQTSGLVYLEAGAKYYFKLLFKEAVGDDHFSVAWEGPGFPMKVIDSSALYSWATPIYESDATSADAYSLGYRVGFLDGSEGLSFSQSYPPLDTDQDGLYDNWEVIMGLNPSNSGDATSDPDNDLLTAIEEFRIGTRENNIDTDGDGIPDGAEFAYSLDPLNAADAAMDQDGDGFSNLEEFIAGTNMDDSADSPVTETDSTATELVAGFTGQYFSGTEFDSYVLTRQGETLQFDWSTNPPLPELPKDRFSARWYGLFTPPHDSGERLYRFTLTSDDGVRMKLGTETAINSWVDRGTTSDVVERSFQAGTAVPIQVEYYEKTGAAIASLTIADAQSGTTFPPQDIISSPNLSGNSVTDSDSDSLPDIWELTYGTDVLVNDAAIAFNGEGITALEAYQSNLHPWTLEPTPASTPSGSTDESVTPAPTGTVTLSWTAPSTRTDGTSISLSEIAYYVLSYGLSELSLDQSLQIDSTQTSHTFDQLSPGTWYFTVRVVDTQGLSSEPSAPVNFLVQ
ncbi:hypothetical protein D777_00873 [Marinobacter nitratireducens]|uniref:PA14 domain-containing protein n=1 Tax=Marinobacter nitratireducens TaxID=1137280 RepID=A0A072N3G7_9GAMM|nr:PA14 domain-containing protein [Marinobacter nitratireducens]KEF32239.1 hypothetical protein D777_00873 [Marinobacter nitratireducens]